MKKPVAEVNIKIFSKNNGRYEADTTVKLHSGKPSVVFVTIEALEDTQRKITDRELKKNLEILAKELDEFLKKDYGAVMYFTGKAAEQHIEENDDYYDNPTTYIRSAHDNQELKDVIHLLILAGGNEIPSNHYGILRDA